MVKTAKKVSCVRVTAMRVEVGRKLSTIEQCQNKSCSFELQITETKDKTAKNIKCSTVVVGGLYSTETEPKRN
jgi:hypothetical protein